MFRYMALVTITNNTGVPPPAPAPQPRKAAAEVKMSDATQSLLLAPCDRHEGKCWTVQELCNDMYAESAELRDMSIRARAKADHLAACLQFMQTNRWQFVDARLRQTYRHGTLVHWIDTHQLFSSTPIIRTGTIHAMESEFVYLVKVSDELFDDQTDVLVNQRYLVCPVVVIASSTSSSSK